MNIISVVRNNFRYNITWKLGLIVFFMFFLISVLSLVTIYNISVLDKNASVLSTYNDTLKLIESLQLRSTDLLSGEKEREARFDQQLVERFKDFDNYMNEFIEKSRKTISSRELRKVISKIESSRENFNSVLNAAYQAYDPEFGVWDTDEIPMVKLMQKREGLNKDIQELLLRNNTILKEMTASSASENKIITIYTIVIMIVILISVVGFSIYLTNKISYPVHRLITAAREIGNGNLDYKVSLDEYDEIGELGQTLNQMSESLRESNEKLRSMLQLAVAVAHEVRNPIAGIGNAIQVISSRFPKDDPYREIISEMTSQIHRVDEIISNLLTYARPVPLKLAECRIRETLINILNFIKASNSYPEVSEEIDLPPDVDPPVTVDAKQFTQVFMNVVINACQAMASTRGAKLRIASSVSGPFLSICVIDNGPGIQPELLGKIFEPFFTTKPKGSGLGLAVSQKIMRSMGGDVTAASDPGKETIFTITIPLANTIASNDNRGTPPPERNHQ